MKDDAPQHVTESQILNWLSKANAILWMSLCPSFSLLQQRHENSRVAAGFGRVSSLWFGCLALKSNDWHHVSHVLILIGGFHFWNIFTSMWRGDCFLFLTQHRTPPAPTFPCGRVVRSTTSKLQDPAVQRKAWGWSIIHCEIPWNLRSGRCCQNFAQRWRMNLITPHW